MEKEDLIRFKELSDKAKSSLLYYLAFRTCYDVDPNMSDEFVLHISKLAYQCWLEDEYTKSGIDDYASLISEFVCSNQLSLSDLENISIYDIVDCVVNEKDFDELLHFDVSEMKYCFTTKNDNKVFLDEAKQCCCEIAPNGKLVFFFFFMINFSSDVFQYYLAENNFKMISMYMHLYIRKRLKEKNLKEYYKSGVKNYEKYCKTHNILSRDITEATGTNEDIDLMSEDKIYTDENKLKKLQKELKTTDDIHEHYSYVASLNNGTDYYYDYANEEYVGIDKNNVTKTFEDEPLFFLGELLPNNKFVYVKKEELDKLWNALDEEYEKSVKTLDISDRLARDNVNKILSKVLNYMDMKEIKEPLNSSMALHVRIIDCLNTEHKKYLISQSEQYQKLKNMELEK